MSIRKVCVVITARPSYSRVRSVLTAVRQHPALELQLVVAASALLERYGNAHLVMEQEGFHIDRRIYMIVEGETLVTSAKSTGLGLAEIATTLDDLKPDMVITIADRFETIATAIAATYLNIPLVHLQGGEVTGSIDEKVRHAITKLADIHLVASDRAATRVIRMGEKEDRVFVTGCPSIDVAASAIADDSINLATIIDRFGGVGERVDLTPGYIVVMQHPVTTEYQQARRHVEETLHAVADSDLPTLWFWPNVDAGSDGTSKGIRAFREAHDLPHIHFFKNLPPEDFLQVLYHSRCIVGNSSVAVRECAYLGVPAINIGTRQNGRDRGRNIVDVDYDRDQIKAAIKRQSTAPRPDPDMLYGDGNAAARIAEVLSTVSLGIEKQLTY